MAHFTIFRDEEPTPTTAQQELQRGALPSLKKIAGQISDEENLEELIRLFQEVGGERHDRDIIQAIAFVQEQIDGEKRLMSGLLTWILEEKIEQHLFSARKTEDVLVQEFISLTVTELGLRLGKTDADKVIKARLERALEDYSSRLQALYRNTFVRLAATITRHSMKTILQDYKILFRKETFARLAGMLEEFKKKLTSGAPVGAYKNYEAMRLDRFAVSNIAQKPSLLLKYQQLLQQHNAVWQVFEQTNPPWRMFYVKARRGLECILVLTQECVYMPFRAIDMSRAAFVALGDMSRSPLSIIGTFREGREIAQEFFSEEKSRETHKDAVVRCYNYFYKACEFMELFRQGRREKLDSYKSPSILKELSLDQQEPFSPPAFAVADDAAHMAEFLDQCRSTLVRWNRYVWRLVFFNASACLRILVRESSPLIQLRERYLYVFSLFKSITVQPLQSVIKENIPIGFDPAQGLSGEPSASSRADALYLASGDPSEIYKMFENRGLSQTVFIKSGRTLVSTDTLWNFITVDSETRWRPALTLLLELFRTMAYVKLSSLGKHFFEVTSEWCSDLALVQPRYFDELGPEINHKRETLFRIPQHYLGETDNFREKLGVPARILGISRRRSHHPELLTPIPTSAEQPVNIVTPRISKMVSRQASSGDPLIARRLFSEEEEEEEEEEVLPKKD
jgi:hypothetical protein